MIFDYQSLFKVGLFRKKYLKINKTHIQNCIAIIRDILVDVDVLGVFILPRITINIKMIIMNYVN